MNKEGKVINKLCAILMIISLLVSDFLFVGTGLISYAIDATTTTSSNVDFTAYFMDNGQIKTDKVQYKIDDENIKLYVDISVKKEGYFNGQISIENGNFDLKQEQTNDYISDISGNTITLNQINAGKNVTVELAIQPKKTEAILNSKTDIAIYGNYIDGKSAQKNKSVEVKGTASVELEWKSKENIQAVLDAKLLTNYTYKNNGEDKKVVQVLLNSKLVDNSYPVKSTQITLNVPDNTKNVYVHARSTDATNKNAKFDEKSYVYNEQNKTLTINVANEDSNISWLQNTQDTFVVTFEFDKSENITNKVIDINSTIKTYDNKELKAKQNVHINDQIDGIISEEIKTEEEAIYKGKLYTGEARDYTQKLAINIDYLNDEQKVIADMNETVYLKGVEEVSSNIFYKETKINKQEFLRLFGQNGFITIKSNNQIIANINKDTQADQDGMITIGSKENYKSINISTSKPVAIGTLNISTTKTIVNTTYPRETVDAFTAIKESSILNNNKSEKVIELKNVETTATLKMTNSPKISTIADSQTLRLEAVLEAGDESKELYKNPKITLTLPDEIKITSYNIDVQNLNGLELDKSKTDYIADNKIAIIFNGEQKAYEGTEGTVLTITLNIKTDKLTPSKNSAIKMLYTNENKNVEKEQTIDVQLESQYGLMIYNKFVNYNTAKETIETVNSDVVYGSIDATADQKAFLYGTAIINNFEGSISNVVLMGSIPGSNGEDTYKASLNKLEIDSKNAKVYYSEKTDIEASDSSWKEELTKDTVSYKIEIPQMAKSEVIKIKATAILPEKIGYNKKGTFTTKTSAIFQGTEQKNSSTVILATNPNVTGNSEEIVDSKDTQNGLNFKTTVTAGNNSLQDKDIVYEGQTLKYNITITNNSGKDYTNVTVNANQTNGLVWDNVETKVINPFDQTQSIEHYYERTDKSSIVIANIPNLKNGDSYTYSYEASAKIIDKNQAETYGMINIKSQDKKLNEKISTIKNSIKTGELQVDLNSGYTSELNLVSGNDVRSILTIKNTTSEDLKELEATILFSSNLVSSVSIPQDISNTVKYEKETIGQNGEKIVTLKISEIKANEELVIELYPYTEKTLKDEEAEVSIIAEVTSSSKNSYVSNKLTRTVVDNSHDIKAEQQGLDAKGNVIDLNKQKLNNGDTVKFVATVTNNENKDINVGINYNIDKMIDVKSASIVNGNEKQDIVDKLNFNNFAQNDQKINAGETFKIELDGTVSTLDIDKITNKLNIYDVETGKSVNNNLSISVNPLTETLVDLSDVDEEETPSEEKPSVTPNTPGGEGAGEGTSGGSTTGGQTRGSASGGQTGNSEGGTTVAPKDNTDNAQATSKPKTFEISGTAWVDKDKDGKKASSEEKVKDIIVEAVSLTKGKVLASTKTDASGNYKFTLEEGKYVLLFNYNNEMYTTTTYKANGTSESENSDAIERNIKFNGTTKKAGITDTITLNSNIKNLDIGLVLRSTFDLKLQKYVSKITVTNKAGTKTYEQPENTTLAKAEIKSKNLSGSLVVIEYKIKVTNVGDVAGYAKQIVDLMPASLNFNSNLNSDWYLSGENLYNTSLANTKIEPGETKELTLVLTKTMTDTNTGLINNKAEVKESSNLLGINDEKRDIGSADVIISVSTGTIVSYVISTITTFIIIAAVAYFINKKYLMDRI